MKRVHYLSIVVSLLPALSLADAGAAITPVVIPSRTAGVAPLSVFFDASGTAAPVSTSRPFHDLDYQWNFGDEDIRWKSGTRPGISSKNLASGPVTAHVFEKPGKYTVTLTVADGSSKTSIDTLISVADPNDQKGPFGGQKTLCVSASMIPVAGRDGCPEGATTKRSDSFSDAIEFAQARHKRILFRSGDVFYATGRTILKTAGPGVIGSYGGESRPVIKANGSGAILTAGDPDFPNVVDWRVMDLEFDGQSNPKVVGVRGGGAAAQLTFLRLNLHDLHSGVSFSLSGLDYQNRISLVSPMYDQISIVDSTILRMVGGSGGNGAFLNSRRLVLMGNFVDDTTQGEHGVRTHYVGKGVVSNNTFRNAASDKHLLTIRGLPFGGTHTLPAETYTEQLVVSDNRLTGTGSAWTMTIAPQNAKSDERIRDVIVERNWFEAGPGTRIALRLEASDVTMRNNICNATGGAGRMCFQVAYDNISGNPIPRQLRFYNNTGYSGDRNNVFVLVGFANKGAEAPSHITMKNNLAVAPNVERILITDTVACSYRCMDTLVQAGNAIGFGDGAPGKRGFVSTPPSMPADFALARGALAVKAVERVPVYSDFFCAPRASPSIGAVAN